MEGTENPRCAVIFMHGNKLPQRSHTDSALALSLNFTVCPVSRRICDYSPLSLTDLRPYFVISINDMIDKRSGIRFSVLIKSLRVRMVEALF